MIELKIQFYHKLNICKFWKIYKLINLVHNTILWNDDGYNKLLLFYSLTCLFFIIFISRNTVEVNDLL